jgi:hypothetical protein
MGTSSGASSRKSACASPVRYFFIKDRIEQGDIALEYLPTAKMIADMLTKPLQGEHFRTRTGSTYGDGMIRHPGTRL